MTFFLERPVNALGNFRGILPSLVQRSLLLAFFCCIAVKSRHNFDVILDIRGKASRFPELLQRFGGAKVRAQGDQQIVCVVEKSLIAVKGGGGNVVWR